MFDQDLRLKDHGLVSSSGYGTVGGEATVLDLGQGLVTGNVIFDIFKIKIPTNNELYRLHLMGGDDENFTNEVSLCCLELGAAEVVEGGGDSVRARYVLPFQNEQAGTIYPYVRIRHEISGSAPGINYKARLCHVHGLRGTTNISESTTTTTTSSSSTTTTTAP
jgi:hypothetical protein